jgi:hypothetical protein
LNYGFVSFDLIYLSLGDFIFKNERKYEQIRRNAMEKIKVLMKNVNYKKIS